MPSPYADAYKRASLYRMYSAPGTPGAYQGKASDFEEKGGGGLGLGNLLSGIGQGITGLATLIAPGSKSGEIGWSNALEGMGSSVLGTAINFVLPGDGDVPFLSDAKDSLQTSVGRTLGDTPEEELALTPLGIKEQYRERGLLPVIAENVGNASLAASAVTAPFKGAAMASKVAGSSETAARLAAVHEGLISRPAMFAVQHPYRTVGKAVRQGVLSPARTQVLEAAGIDPRPVSEQPVDFLASELPDTGVDYRKVAVDMDEHAARAKAYKDLPDDDPEAHAAFESFRNEVNEQYRHVTEDLGLAVEMVDEDPYPSYKEMVEDVRTNKRIRVFKTGEGEHPYLTPEENDRFRAVHDLYGHAGTARDFGRHGEEAAFLAHSSMFGPEAQRALATETRGQNSVLIQDGEFAPQKVALLPEDLSSPDGAVARFQKQPVAEPGRVTRFLGEVENRIVAREGAAKIRQETRMAEMERRMAARSPAVRMSVRTAQDYIIEKAAEQGAPISRKQASLIVGDELRARMTGTKILEEEYLARGLPEDVVASAVGRQAWIPAHLRTPELEAALADAVQAQVIERTAVRETLSGSRKGDEGLEPVDAMEPALTKRQAKTLRQAEKRLERADSDIQGRKIEREQLRSQRVIASKQDRLGSIAAELDRIESARVNALAAFEHSRTWTPRAWKGEGAMEASAQTIYEQTLANVAEHDGEWGGASFNPHTGRFVVGGDDTGFAVGLVPETAVKVPLDEFTPQHIEQVIRAYQDVYQHPNTIVGTWVEDGYVHIDPSEIVATKDDALIRGAARAQEATYDIGGDDVVGGILKDRPDIAAPFVGRHRNLSKRAKELREISKTADFSEGDVNVMLDLLMRQAVTAHEKGLVSHPDEFFRKYVSKFEKAKRPSGRPGVLGQIVLERAIGTPEERAALWRDMTANIQDIDKVRAWYHESHDLVERLFRHQPEVTLLDGSKINPADLMYQIVAATSFQASPRDNWTRAMAVFQRFDDLPAKEMQPLVRAMKKVTAGKATLGEAFGVIHEAGLADRFSGVGLYGTPKQYIAEILSGNTIDKWTPETMAASKEGFGIGSVPDRAKALDFIHENYPDLIERIGEDEAVKEFWGRQHRAKIITFADNLQNPERSLGVTMDQQMERLFGEEMPISQTAAGNDAWIRYSEQVRDMAEELTNVTGEKILPHELQAVMWVYAKDEVARLQMGHFNALASEAAEAVRSGAPLTDDIDPILQWIDEASEPYVTEGQRHARTQKIERDGVVSEEEVVFRPGWGAGNREKKIDLFAKRKVQWLAVRDEINADLVVGDTAAANKRLAKYVTNMQTKAPRSLGLADDASGASFLDIWMKGDFHSKGYLDAADALDRLDVSPGDLPPLMQSFRDKVLGEFVPMDDGTRGVIRIFEDGNLATLVHENGHLLRRILDDGQARAIEGAYGLKGRVWDVAAEERFANDFLHYMQTAEAPKGLHEPFMRVREALSRIWEMVRSSFQGNRVHPELAEVFEDWLSPAEAPVAEGIAGLPDLTETGTLRQRVTRPPKFPEPPAKKGDHYTSGRKGAEALAQIERLAARKKYLAAQAANIEKQVEAVRTVLEEGRLPSQLERDDLVAKATRDIEKVRAQADQPSISRTPARWQPMMQAVRGIAAEAVKDPGLADVLDGLPETLSEIQRLAAEHGVDPTHVSDLSPARVKRLVHGSMRLGVGRDDLLKEATAGTRKNRTGALSKAGAVDRSIEGFMASVVEATVEKRTNAVIDWIEGNVSRRVEAGQEIPEGWTVWDPVRTYLMTGTEVSEKTRKAVTTATSDMQIVPTSVVKTIDRYTKDYDHWVFNAISKVTSPWRTLVLALSPGWYVRNVVGNVILAEAEGVSLRDWQAAWKSAKTKDEIGRFADIPFVTTDTLAQQAGHLAEDSLIPRRGIGQAIDEGGRIRGSAGYVLGRMMRVNEVVDEFARASVYHKGRRLNMTPEQAWTRASEALVDYNNLTPFERSAVRSVIPFYTWQKGILKVTMNQVLDHPARASVLLLLGQMQDEYLADRFGVAPGGVPGYYKHLVGDRNLRSFNPFSDPSEIVSPEGIARSFNPFIELAVRKGMGAPEFYTDDQRMGFYGSVEDDVDLVSGLTELVTESPGGRVIGGDSTVPGFLGVPQPVDEAKLRARFQGTQKSVYGPQPLLPNRG